MKIENKNITGSVIATIISLITIVTVFSGFISNQAKLETQLAHIQKELVTINEKLDMRDSKINTLEKDMAVIKEQLKERR